MRVDQVLRAAREHAGVGQRALAERAGLSASSIADTESGLRRPAWATVQAAVEAAGLSLVLAPRTPELTPDQRSFLNLPLADRLYQSLGGQGDRRFPRDWSPAWRELMHLVRDGTFGLAGRSALACWVPGAELPRPMPVRTRCTSATFDPSALEHFVVEDGPIETQGQWVLWLPRFLRLPDALSLSLRADCALEAPLLRAAVSHHDDRYPRGADARRLGAHKRGARGSAPYAATPAGGRSPESGLPGADEAVPVGPAVACGGGEGLDQRRKRRRSPGRSWAARSSEASSRTATTG